MYVIENIGECLTQELPRWPMHRDAHCQDVWGCHEGADRSALISPLIGTTVILSHICFHRGQTWMYYTTMIPILTAAPVSVVVPVVDLHDRLAQLPLLYLYRKLLGQPWLLPSGVHSPPALRLEESHERPFLPQIPASKPVSAASFPSLIIFAP